MKVTGPGTGPAASGGADAPSDAAGTGGPGEAQPERRGDAAGDAKRLEQRGGSFAEKLAAPVHAGSIGPTSGPMSGPMSGPTAATHPSRPAPSNAAASVRDVGALSTDVQAGRISAASAVDKIVQQVLDRQLGAGAPAAIRSKVEAALRDALESDPLLGEKLKALGG